MTSVYGGTSVFGNILSRLNREGKGNFIKIIRIGTCVQDGVNSTPSMGRVSRLDAARWINPSKVQCFLPLRSSLIRCLQEWLLSRQMQACSHSVLWSSEPSCSLDSTAGLQLFLPLLSELGSIFQRYQSSRIVISASCMHGLSHQFL